MSGEGQPLVFIHGLGSSTLDWDFQVSEFSRSYKVITFDLRGHGQSDHPAGPYDFPLFAADMAGLLQALDLESAHLVGISLGGAVAFQFAIDDPALVKTLTIVNSGPTLNEDPAEARQLIEHRVGIVQQVGMRGMGQALSEALFPRPEHASLRETLVERWSENDPRGYIEALRGWFGWNVMDKLGSIHCPTLVISADQDIWPVEDKAAYVKLIPDAQLVVISDTHHFVTREQPGKFNAVLTGFLSKHR